MKRFTSTTIFVSLVCAVANCQVTTNTTLTPTQLVNNVLLGNGITATNVTQTGYSLGVAQFNATPNTNLGFSTGLYLTSGSALQTDPNNPFSDGTDGPEGPATNEQGVSHDPSHINDPDLHVLLASIGYDTTQDDLTNDVSILEFDFVPTSDSISFRYRFGSEEYNEWVNEDPTNGFNDIFGFFLRGVSPAAQAQYPGYIDIALVPGTTTPVSIFSINNGTNFPGNMANGPCMNCAFYEDNFNNAVDVVYDGLTVILTAKAEVICGETYHIKLAVADVADQVFDSGVFIEGGSFSSSGSDFQIVSEVEGDTENNNLVENCDAGKIILTRNNSTDALSVDVFYTGTADAANDFNGLPANSVQFNAGQDTVEIDVQAINDNLPDDAETLNMGFIVTSACNGSTDTLFATFNVTEPPAITVDAGDDVTDCNPNVFDVVVTAVTAGGSAPNTFNWNTGENTADKHITMAGQYIVTVTDRCGQTATDTVMALVEEPDGIGVDAGDDVTNCNPNGFNDQVTALPIGGSAPITFNWNTGENTADKLITTAGEYIVTVTDRCGQTASDTVMALVVEPTPIEVSLTEDFSVCAGTQAILQANVVGGEAPVTLQWSNGSTANPLQVTISNTGTFTATVTDACGQTATDDIAITANEVSAAFTHSTSQMGMQQDFMNQSTPDNLTYRWDFGDGSSSGLTNPQYTYGNPGSYVVSLTATDEMGCTDVAKLQINYVIPSEVFIPNTFTPNSDGINDSWRISISYLENFRLRVFDRWGLLVFETSDLFTTWKGSYFNEGKVLKTDRYIYRIQYTEYRGKDKEILGSVTLLK